MTLSTKEQNIVYDDKIFMMNQNIEPKYDLTLEPKYCLYDDFRTKILSMMTKYLEPKYCL